MFNFVSFEIGINQWSHHHNQINMHFYHPSKSFRTSLVTQIVKKVKTKVKVAQSCLTLWDLMDYTVHRILQAGILEWVAISFSRWSSQPGDWTHVSLIAGGFFTSWATREDSKESACNERGLGLIPGSGRSPGEGNGNPLRYSCLENSMDWGAWWATVHGVKKNRIWLSDYTFTAKEFSRALVKPFISPQAASWSPFCYYKLIYNC